MNEHTNLCTPLLEVQGAGTSRFLFSVSMPACSAHSKLRGHGTSVSRPALGMGLLGRTCSPSGAHPLRRLESRARASGALSGCDWLAWARRGGVWVSAFPGQLQTSVCIPFPKGSYKADLRTPGTLLVSG